MGILMKTDTYADYVIVIVDDDDFKNIRFIDMDHENCSEIIRAEAIQDCHWYVMKEEKRKENELWGFL